MFAQSAKPVRGSKKIKLEGFSSFRETGGFSNLYKNDVNILLIESTTFACKSILQQQKKHYSLVQNGLFLS